MATQRFSNDSRNLSGHDSEVFVAIKAKRDGHDFIQEAYNRGVTSFIVERKPEKIEANFLVVEDSLKALQEIAKYHRNCYALPIVGITGSNGKTIVKEWLSTLLSEKLVVIKSPLSYNSQIGVPLSLLQIRNYHDVAVFEAGLSIKNEMHVIQKIMQPEIGIFTNLGAAHDEGFSSRTEKLREKLQLFKSSKKVICRADQECYANVKAAIADAELISWGVDKTGTYQVSWSPNTIKINGHSFHSELHQPSDLENITHALVAALELGLTEKVIQAGLNKISSVPMRLALKEGINDSIILDDSYNNDLYGLETALDYLDFYDQGKSHTVILSDIYHSGKPEQQLYTEVAALFARKRVSRLIGVGPQITRNQALFQLNKNFFPNTETLLDELPQISNQIVLVKGARDFAFEKLVDQLEERRHGTCLQVDLNSLKHNLDQYRNRLSPETKIMVMVKADAYGIGIVEVSQFLQRHKIDYLGVAYLDEAVTLRKHGIDLPIMIMNPLIERFDQFEKYDLEPEIFDLDHLKRFLRDTNQRQQIHLKVDTGMHRLGFRASELDDLIAFLRQNTSIRIASIFTHFAGADSAHDDEYTIRQATLFESAYEKITDAIGYRPIKHACNSPAMVRWPQYHFDLVRLGIGIYGFDPTGLLNLKNAGTLVSVVSQVKRLKKDEFVGYSRKGKLKEDGNIAIVPLGYADGFLRLFGNGKAKVMINGRLYPTIGNVCMDMVMIDVGNDTVQAGDQVIFFGEKLPIENLAKVANTIPYELLTNISNRVKRVYIS